jgi:hypothetical protein
MNGSTIESIAIFLLLFVGLRFAAEYFSLPKQKWRKSDVSPKLKSEPIPNSPGTWMIIGTVIVIVAGVLIYLSN